MSKRGGCGGRVMVNGGVRGELGPRSLIVLLALAGALMFADPAAAGPLVLGYVGVQAGISADALGEAPGSATCTGATVFCVAESSFAQSELDAGFEDTPGMVPLSLSTNLTSGTTSASASASANFGTLSYNGSGATSYQPAGGSNASVGSYIGGYPSANFADRLTITGAPGATVTLTFDLAAVLASSCSGSGCNDGNTEPSAEFEVYDEDSAAPGTIFDVNDTALGDFSEQETITATVGDILFMGSGLFADFEAPNFADNTSGSFSFSETATMCIAGASNGGVTSGSDPYDPGGEPAGSGTNYACAAAASAVPEPSTLALLTAGLFGFGATRRHKRKDAFVLTTRVKPRRAV